MSRLPIGLARQHRWLVFVIFMLTGGGLWIAFGGNSVDSSSGVQSSSAIVALAGSRVFSKLCTVTTLSPIMQHRMSRIANDRDLLKEYRFSTDQLELLTSMKSSASGASGLAAYELARVTAQQFPMEALGVPELHKALHLSHSQIARIDDLRSTYRFALSDLRKQSDSMPRLNRVVHGKQVTEYEIGVEGAYWKATEAIYAVLSTRQLCEWKEALGNPVRLEPFFSSVRAALP